MAMTQKEIDVYVKALEKTTKELSRSKTKSIKFLKDIGVIRPKEKSTRIAKSA